MCRTMLIIDRLRKRQLDTKRYTVWNVMCVCHPIYSGRQTVDAPAEVTHEEGHTGLLRLPPAVLPLIFIARRIQPSLSFVDR